MMHFSTLSFFLLLLILCCLPSCGNNDESQKQTSTSSFIRETNIKENPSGTSSYVPNELLIQFKYPVWDFPSEKESVSFEELQNLDPKIKTLFQNSTVYKVKLQLDVDKVLEKAKNKYPRGRFQALAERLPKLRNRYLLYLSDPSKLEALKSSLDQLPQVKKTSYNHYLSSNISPNDPFYSNQWGPSVFYH